MGRSQGAQPGLRVGLSLAQECKTVEDFIYGAVLTAERRIDQSVARYQKQAAELLKLSAFDS